ncbi:general stress protein [Bacillus sp. V3-13]|uniref:general stress protein n=1 Tax=Bacillus sp. V3-13 TaxID=2053728 RepID=UPI0015E0BA35|nr:general stress protein [Bacillus sp. V3-13]
MTWNAVGVFGSKKEVVKVIEQLKSEGVSLSEMFIIGNDLRLIAEISKQTGIHSLKRTLNTPEKDNGVFMHNLATAFDDLDDRSGYKKILSSFGLSEQDAAEYQTYIEDGLMVLLVDEDDT